jgi:hypothetical protein
MCVAKSSLEKALEKYQKEVAKNTKKKIDADKRLADKQRRENQRQARIDACRECAASVVSGQPTVAGVKILDPASEELISLIIAGCKNDNYRITNNDVNIPTYLESDLALEFEKLKQYGMISSYGYYISGCWELTILPCMLTYFERKEIALMEEKQAFNTNNFYGDVTGVQIQQGTINSTQNQTITQDFDYDAVSDVIENIKKYDAMFESEFGENATELRNKLDEIETLIKSKENPSKIKALLLELKNLAVGVTGSLIASGIAAQIPMF